MTRWKWPAMGGPDPDLPKSPMRISLTTRRKSLTNTSSSLGPKPKQSSSVLASAHAPAGTVATQRMNQKMAEAVTRAKMPGTAEVDAALGSAAPTAASRKVTSPRS